VVLIFPNPSYTASATFMDYSLASSDTCGLAWDGTDYWDVHCGFANVKNEGEYSGAFTLLNQYQTTLDFRSIFTINGQAGTVYARQFNDPVIYTQTGPGTFAAGVTLTGGTLNLQAKVMLNTAGTELVENNSGTVNRWNAQNGTFIGTVTLNGFGTLNTENAFPQNVSMATASGLYLTYSNGVLSAWSTTGSRLATTTLTAGGNSLDANISISYANGLVWIVDVTAGTWRGYNVGL
jgi:hypothetical protein